MSPLSKLLPLSFSKEVKLTGVKEGVRPSSKIIFLSLSIKGELKRGEASLTKLIPPLL
jgi:hypothetical protein